ncbi:putative LysR family transcriptional regulator [Gordonia effusa NBRC 100432]|uniref:Putative LysR family transcriptional regulator n=2 Tax=Gordonia effusa TaxID=263908 RepID=H0R578_9ACTN|nr:putative LysR family transcriptional regulator [Gordonia effusa NBRC 100432]
MLAMHTRELMPSLAAFEVVATTGHVTRGAALLDLPQSSISRRLHALEKTLGVTLFVPAGRRLVLTAAGRELLASIRGPLRAIDHALSAAVDDADPDAGLVRFGFPLSLGPNLIPKMLAEFHDIAPRIRLVLRQAHGAELVRCLREGELDLAIVIPTPTGLPTAPLGTQRLSVHVPRDHRLARRKRIRLTDLADEDFIANPSTYHLRQETLRWCAAAGFEPRVTVEVADFETMRSMVARGLGIAIMPQSIDADAADDVVALELTGGDFTRSVGLAMSSSTVSAAALRLQAHVRNRFPEIASAE